MLYTRNAIIILICEGHRLVTRVYIFYAYRIYYVLHTLASRCV